jgi:hypothetical protein
MDQVTSESTLEELQRARERVKRWPSGQSKAAALRALDEWIARRELYPSANGASPLDAASLQTS